MKTILVIGLGNPGKKYAQTRHNAGFVFADYFFENYREKFGFSDWEFKKNLNAKISIGKIKKTKKQNPDDIKIILLKPQTFMNLSGEATAAARKYYKSKIENIIVAHDDIDLPLGKYKISKNSSSAGHNGVQTIMDILGTKNFTRIRIGIEHRGDKKIATEKYVLGKFTAAEMKTISKILPLLSDELIF